MQMRANNMCNAQLFFLISSITKPESRTPVNPPNQTASPHNIETSKPKLRALILFTLIS